MKKSAWRLALSATLFVVWIGYLAYLADTATKPIVLSRSQFLDADLWVLAEVPSAAADQPSSTVTVKRVFWADKAVDRDLKTIQVAGLRSVKELQNDLEKAVAALATNKEFADPAKRELEKKSLENKFDLEKKFVWDKPGEYILALSRSKTEPPVYSVAPLPRTPGFASYAGRVYSSTPATLQQLELLKKEFHP